MVSFKKDSEVRVFENQVAGCHDGKLSSILKDDKHNILKPYKLLSNTTWGVKPDETDEIVPFSPNELEFYNLALASTEPILQEMVLLMPKFCGSRTVNEIDHVVLEDITHGMKYPCVADVKLGKNRNYPGRNLEKAKKSESKYPSTADCGFSLAGMKIYDGKTGKKITHLSSPLTSTLTTGEVFEYLMSFFRHKDPYCNDIVDSVIDELRHIQKWATNQRRFVFFGSSILMCYDAADVTKFGNDGEDASSKELPAADDLDTIIGDGDSNLGLGTSQDPGKPSIHARVKMIDFAHVFYAKDEGGDESYLDAMKNLTNFILKLKR